MRRSSEPGARTSWSIPSTPAGALRPGSSTSPWSSCSARQPWSWEARPGPVPDPALPHVGALKGNSNPSSLPTRSGHCWKTRATQTQPGQPRTSLPDFPAPPALPTSSKPCFSPQPVAARQRGLPAGCGQEWREPDETSLPCRASGGSVACKAWTVGRQRARLPGSGAGPAAMPSRCCPSAVHGGRGLVREGS